MIENAKTVDANARNYASVSGVALAGDNSSITISSPVFMPNNLEVRVDVSHSVSILIDADTLIAAIEMCVGDKETRAGKKAMNLLYQKKLQSLC